MARHNAPPKKSDSKTQRFEFTPQGANSDRLCHSLASDKTHSKAFDLGIPEQWVRLYMYTVTTGPLAYWWIRAASVIS